MVASEELDKDWDYFYLNLPDSRLDLSTSNDTDEEGDGTGEEGDGTDEERNDTDEEGDNTNEEGDTEEDDNIQADLNPDISESPSLVGTWSGFYYGFSTSSDIDGITSFQINDLDGQGGFIGGGCNSVGDFSIEGTLKGKTIVFSKKYSQPVDGRRWEYLGEINEGLDRIEGKWGGVESAPSGIFDLQKKPVEDLQFRPSREMDGKKKLRLLWTFAIEVTLHRLSTRTIRWSVLKKRRDQRRRFIALFKRSQEVDFNRSEEAELKTLQSTLSTADFEFYKGLTLFERDREVIHCR